MLVALAVDLLKETFDRLRPPLVDRQSPRSAPDQSVVPLGAHGDDGRGGVDRLRFVAVVPCYERPPEADLLRRLGEHAGRIVLVDEGPRRAWGRSRRGSPPVSALTAGA